MEIIVSRFRECDIDTVFEIQRAAYKPLYEKYQDDSTNPYMESKETVLRKYTRAGTSGYLFFIDATAVGAVRINFDDVSKSGRVSALCVLPQYQGRGIAQAALMEIERMHPNVERWFLDTILEEAGNCHLYEKIGYKKTGKTEMINEKMTLVFYEKKQTNSSLSVKPSENAVFSRHFAYLVFQPYVFSLVFALTSRNKGKFFTLRRPPYPAVLRKYASLPL